MVEVALSLVTARPFSDALLGWFDQEKRDLPWRRTQDAYAIWVSEMMLQQTRVAAVLEHYARWMARFPTIAALARADESEVLALWSGLGYYRRARYLHAGARAIVADYQGELPRSAAALRRLPGIGEYTSAAIASIAFGEAVAVVDGNVERVIMRLAGIVSSPAKLRSDGLSSDGTRSTAGQSHAGESVGTQAALQVAGAAWPRDEGAATPRSLGAAELAREIRRVAHGLLVPERPGDFNQAMMELGATVCLPRAPLCLQCPVQPWCATRGEHSGAPKRAMQSRSIDYALAARSRDGDQEVLLVQRAADASLMAGMWELPELTAALGSRVLLLTVRHAITVTNYTVRVAGCTKQEVAAVEGAPGSRWVLVARLPDTALTGLARKVLKRLALWPKAEMVRTT